ncbi:Collectin-46, partial [Biomphalaria glabrata]
RFVSLILLLDVVVNQENTTNSGFIRWNKTYLSALEFQLSVCPRRCNGSVYVPGNQTMLQFRCKRCHCDRPTCEIYGRCCPDISVPVHKLNIGLLSKDRYPSTNRSKLYDYGFDYGMPKEK